MPGRNRLLRGVLEKCLSSLQLRRETSESTFASTSPSTLFRAGTSPNTSPSTFGGWGFGTCVGGATPFIRAWRQQRSSSPTYGSLSVVLRRQFPNMAPGGTNQRDHIHKIINIKGTWTSHEVDKESTSLGTSLTQLLCQPPFVARLCLPMLVMIVSIIA